MHSPHTEARLLVLNNVDTTRGTWWVQTEHCTATEREEEHDAVPPSLLVQYVVCARCGGRMYHVDLGPNLRLSSFVDVDQDARFACIVDCLLSTRVLL